MRICVYMCDMRTCVYMCVNMGVLHMSVYAYTYVYKYICIRMYVSLSRLQTLPQLCVHVYTCARACVYMRIHTPCTRVAPQLLEPYTNICTHMYACTRARVCMHSNMCIHLERSSTCTNTASPATPRASPLPITASCPGATDTGTGGGPSALSAASASASNSGKSVP